MLQILTVCGAGLGSSFACQMSVDAVLKELGVEAKLDHTDISSVGEQRLTSFFQERTLRNSLSVIHWTVQQFFSIDWSIKMRSKKN